MYNGFKPANIRKENLKQIISLFIKSSALLSRADVARILSLSAPSVSTIINKLIEKDILYEKEDGVSSNLGGRKPVMLDLNENCGFIIGVHLSGSELIILLSNISGKIIAKKAFPYKFKDKNNCMPFLIDKIKDLISINNIDQQKVLSIGLSVPGIFDNEEKIIKFAPNIQIWENIPIEEKLLEVFNCEINIENAVNVAVLGERWKGQITGKKNAIYIKVDQGIGAGILIDGKLYKGYKDVAGEIGYMVTDKEDISRRDNYGSLENKCRTESIINSLKKLTGEDNLTIDNIVSMFKMGNKQVHLYLEELCSTIALTIANIVCVINPEIVVIGGEFSKIAKIFETRIYNILEKIVPVVPTVVISDLGDNAYYYGSIYQSHHDIESKLVGKFFNFER